MSRFDFNNISPQDQADITKVMENFNTIDATAATLSDVETLQSHVDDDFTPKTRTIANIALQANITANDLANELRVAMGNLMYPVGSIYMSTQNTNPSTYFGGTWMAWGSGRVPVGVNTSDNDFKTVEKTGGAKTVTLSIANLPSHTHTYAKANGTTGNTTLTLAQIPAHTHYYNSNKSAIWTQQTGYGNVNTASSTGANRINVGSTQTESAGGGKAHNHSISTTSTNTGSTGSGAAVNNLQPYITCYMWKRTA